MQAAHLTFNQLWVAILVAPNEAAPEDLEDELAQLATFLGEQALGANHTPSPDWVAWFYRCLGQLQLVTHQLQRIYSLPKG